jgi:hypothetical protein
VHLIRPTLPDYDIETWRALPYPERLRLACVSWATQGYGTPFAIYVAYTLKVVFYVWVWALFCSATPGLGDLGAIATWWDHPTAFQKAILWSIAFETLGLGCGSGPLTGRYLPPFSAFLHFLRPGTIRLPPYPRLPGTRGHLRTLTDVALYAALHVALLGALTAPEVTRAHVGVIIAALVLCGLRDKTIFLAARAEHYLTAVVCLLFVDWLPANKVVWAAVWYWAAISKLNHHFPSVVAVMQSNSPLTEAFPSFRKALFRRYPDDLRPSRMARWMAHMGTALELTFPTLLLLGDGGTLTLVALGIMFVFHTFITSSIPMGVPIEWNVMMVYGAFFLFGTHAGVSPTDVTSPFLLVFLPVALVALQVFGNLYPQHVSFLMSMRYYAGNWAYSAWLFRPEAEARLESHIKKVSASARTQLSRLYDDDTVTKVLAKVPAFRAMHLQGRPLADLLPRAVDDPSELDTRLYYDGELVAGAVLGWNFGEGHLHDMQLLEALQTECGFAPGDVRVVMVESQPMHQQRWTWTIADAADGVLERGETSVASMRSRQPWG